MSEEKLYAVIRDGKKLMIPIGKWNINDRLKMADGRSVSVRGYDERGKILLQPSIPGSFGTPRNLRYTPSDLFPDEDGRIVDSSYNSSRDSISAAALAGRGWDKI